MKLSDILTAVCRYYAIPEHDVRSRVRFRERVRVRAAYFYLARTLTGATYMEIASTLGMDHSTIMYGISIVATDRRLEQDCRVIMLARSPRGIPQEWVATCAR